jgi:hypothetical protein
MAVRIVSAVFFVILAASIIWAFTAAPFWESFGLITANPWGKVTLIDLYSGFFFAAVVMGIVHGPIFGAVAFVLLCVLGNVVSLAWLAWHGFTLLMSLVDKN